MLSKSEYISGQQCDQLLWFKSTNKKPPEERDEGTKDRLKAGEHVGNYAKELFPEGTEIEYLRNNPQKMVEDTIKTGVRQSFPLKIDGMCNGEIICEFALTLSLKYRS